MAQSSSRFCPQCGTPAEAGQRFCSNCGATMDMNVANPTARTPGGNSPVNLPYDAQPTNMPAASSPTSLPPSIPPPPPPGSFIPAQPSPYTQYPPSVQGGMQSASSYSPTPLPGTVPDAPPAPAPSYAKPQKDSSKSVLGQIGCGVLVVILLIVGLCGGASYLGYRYISSISSTPDTTTNTGSTTQTGSGNSQSNTPTSSQVVTKKINQTITYASMDITIQNVQQASSFADDNNSGSNGIVRINVNVNNTSSGSLLYSDVLRLILPDKSSVAPSNTKAFESPAAQTTQTNWWDFQVPTSVSIDQLTLLLGKPTDAQMQVPLTGNANLSQYQPKTITPNAQTQYQGLNWTITSASKSWSGYGKQAPQGQRYVTVTLKVDNNSSQYFSRYYGDYARLKSGSSTSSPTTDSTLPTSFAAGSTGTTGTLIFLMPDNSTDFTLILLGNTTTSPPISQATINFQIS